MLLTRISARAAAPNRHFLRRHMSAAAAATTTATPNIIFEDKGGARIYTLNRPKALNALSRDMFNTMVAKVDEWREDKNVNIVLGLGEGRAFAAGGDIKAVVEAMGTGNSIEALKSMATSYRLNWKVAHFGKPYVAFIDGIVMGGGAGLSLPADIRIATRRTMFALPEQRIGFSPDVASYFLTQLDGQIGTWIAVTGTDIYGRAAYELGLATHYVSEESVPEITARIADMASPSTAVISALVAEYHVEGNDLPSSKDNPDGTTEIRGAVRVFLDETFSLPSLEAIYTHLEASEGNADLPPDVRQWAADQRAMMDARGPTGMAVAVASYNLAATARNYAAAIDRDMCIGASFVGPHRASPDLIVGAVHVLFDKKRTPIPFDPPITDLGNAKLKPEAIVANHLTRANLPDACAPELIPLPADAAASPDALWGHFRAYGIPSEHVVRQAAGSAPVSDEELVSRVLSGAAPDKADARRDEFERTVRRIAAERMERNAEGLLTWRE